MKEILSKIFSNFLKIFKMSKQSVNANLQKMIRELDNVILTSNEVQRTKICDEDLINSVNSNIVNARTLIEKMLRENGNDNLDRIKRFSE